MGNTQWEIKCKDFTIELRDIRDMHSLSCNSAHIIASWYQKGTVKNHITSPFTEEENLENEKLPCGLRAKQT